MTDETITHEYRITLGRTGAAPHPPVPLTRAFSREEIAGQIARERSNHAHDETARIGVQHRCVTAWETIVPPPVSS